MKKLAQLLFATLAFLTIPALQAGAPLWCIVGGTRGVGYALAQELCKDNTNSCTLFVRDGQKATTLFQNSPVQPNVIEGDSTTQLDKLISATTGATYLVIAALFPYEAWTDGFQATVINCIAAAQATNATIIYYGRIYRYGLINPITETSVAAPNSDQGRLYDEMEKLIEEATTKTILIHHSYPFGPNVGDGLLEKNFKEIPKNKNKSWYQSKQKFEWIGDKNTKVKQQFTYLPDLAKFTMLFASQQQNNNQLSVSINFAGITVDSIDEFGNAYATAAQVPYELDLFSLSMLTIAAAFKPEAQRAKDVYYAFVNELLLDNTFEQTICPFTLTPLAQALDETCAFYASAQ